MKKLMAMIGAVAMAFGLYADGYSALEYSPAKFELADGTKTIVGYTDDATTPYTTSGSVINWWSTNCQETDFEQPATVVAPDGGTSYLQIETDGTPMLRTFNKVESDDLTAQAIEPHGLFVDMKVQLTGFEPDSEVKTGDGNKLLVWLKAGEGDEGEGIEGVTNLMVTCGYLKGQTLVATNHVLVAMDGSALDVKPGDWVQFTVRANQGTKNIPTFNIYVNQQQVKAIVDGEDLLAFPSLIGGASELVLKAAGFEGNGAIENVNLYGQANAPAWAADPTIMNIVWDANVKSLKINDVDVIAAGEDSPLAYPVPFGETITAEIEYADGYRKGSVTGTGANLSEFTETDDGATFKVAQYATVADAQLAVVSERDRDEASLVIDGEVIGTFSSLAGVFAKIKDLYPEMPEGEIPVATITLNENATADDFGFNDEIYPDITIDLNGKTIECTNGDPNFVAFDAYGALEIIDTNTEDAGTIIGNIYADYMLIVREAASGLPITIDGSIDYQTEGQYPAEITIERGKFNDPMPAGEFVQLGKEGEDMEWDGPDKDGFYVLRAAEPPVPGEKGFKVIISGVETQVDTLAEALASADNNTTITFLADVTDATGMTVDTKKTLTVDFAGFTYTVNKPGAGSPSTMTQAFQLLKGQTLTFKNGTIQASVDNLVLATVGKNIKRFFQSYANFTLEDMTLDGTNLYLNPTDNAMCEFANGTVAITGDTTILANKENLDAISIDTWKGKYPAGVNVTIDTTGTISSVKVWTEGTGDFTPGQVALEAGTITELKVDGNDADYAIAKSEDVTITTTPAGYFWDNNVLAKCAAEIDGTYYNTLAAAFTAAQDNDEIVLLKDVELEAPIKVAKKVTLNIGDFDITPATPFGADAAGTKDTLFVVNYGGDFTVVGNEGVIDSSSQESIYSAIKLTEKNETSDGTLRAKLTVDANLIGYYYAITGHGSRGYTDLTVEGGSLSAVATDTNLGIYNPQKDSTVVINAGTITGLDSAIEMRGGTLTVNGGELVATATEYSVTPNGSGSTTKGAAVAVAQHNTQGDIAVTIAGGELVGLNAVSVANPQENETENVGVVLGADATYDGALAFSADGNATVTNDGATIDPPADYKWDENGNLVKKVYVAQIVDGAKFESLNEAFAAAVDGDEIAMLDDVTLSERIFVKEDITLDLAGKKIEWDTSIANKSGVLIVCRDAQLTIDDSSEPSTGVIDAKGKAYAAVALTHGDDPKNNQTDLTARLIVNGGKLNGNYQGIVGNGNRPNTYIEVNDGEITATFVDPTPAEDGVAIYNPQANSQVVINGGYIHADASAIEIRAGQLTVNGGTLESTAESFVVAPNGNGSTTIGAAVAVAQHTTTQPITAEIAGGTLDGFYSVAVTNPQKSPEANVSVLLGADATYSAPLYFSADENATVAKDPEAQIEAPQGYRWNENGVLVKLVTATFISEGETVDTQVIDAGTAPTNVVVTKEGYTFTGWDPEISEITEDTTYTAQFEIQMLTLTVPACEHAKVTVKYGEDPSTTDTTNGVYTLAYNTYYLVTYAADTGYELTGQVSANGNIQENTVLTGPTARAKKFYVQTFTNGVEYVQETYTFGDQAISLTPPVLASDEEWDEKWYTDETYETQWTFDGAVAGNTQRAYAKITKKAPTYPDDWPATDDATKAKFATWLAGKGAGADLSTDAAKSAFLLNCTVAEVATEAAAFKITAFTGTKTSVVTPMKNTKGDDFNGVVTVKAFSDVACTTEVEPASQAALFFKAFLDFQPAE